MSDETPKRVEISYPLSAGPITVSFPVTVAEDEFDEAEAFLELIGKKLKKQAGVDEDS